MNFAEYLRTLFLQNTSVGCFLWICFHLDYLLLLLRSPLLLWACICLLGKVWITIDVLQILEIPYPANKYPKSTTETLKLDGSLLTACNMSKTLFKCFSGVLWTWSLITVKFIFCQILFCFYWRFYHYCRSMQPLLNLRKVLLVYNPN